MRPRWRHLCREPRQERLRVEAYAFDPVPPGLAEAARHPAVTRQAHAFDTQRGPAHVPAQPLQPIAAPRGDPHRSVQREPSTISALRFRSHRSRGPGRTEHLCRGAVHAPERESPLHRGRLASAQRVDFALGRFLGAVVLVRVTVEDVNGPRGGVDVRCKLRATLGKGGNPVLAEVLERDGIAAIDRASERLGRNLARRLSVKRKLRRARI